ncbi:putative alkaloid synthase/Surface mucin Hemomucin [Handroanthus impetiginosus]|uniref:Putative alkaloid synthase/Surface mucin Hemomucin n=1 Tax=Handroanthus impetiginosus TaxID=429701 RepID=A0A2G9HHQ2_9LAMI|nr:putative alkaloid synthase/Surface mucin Hemomucin [Handroanthus impetiginosus]
MVPIFILFFFCFPNNALAYSFKSLHLPTGSEACAFDSKNGGPYTGLNDGRIVKYEGPKRGFVDFATTAPNRSKELCDGTDKFDMETGPLCGRPLALEFDHKTGNLYIVDAFRGLMVVGSGGGVATRLSDKSDGLPYNFPDALSIDPVTGTVYYTDIGSLFFTNKNMSEILVSGYKNGRLLKYDPKTRRSTVVLTGLAGPAGVVVGKDGSFIVFSEYLACRLTRFWLKGPKANTMEVFVELPGNPDNLLRTKSGDFWVAVNIQKLQPRLISFPLGQKISARGRILKTVNFYAEYNETYITEVHEHLGSFFVSSVYANGIGAYRGVKF